GLGVVLEQPPAYDLALAVRKLGERLADVLLRAGPGLPLRRLVLRRAMLTPTTDFTVNTTDDELVFEAGSIPAEGEIIQIPFFYLPEA
ncbi:MAG TPA: hypothetical protein VK972_00825, partial [Wenzhouxiangella sp.]|nr:hypothetical protein [Wenzhouxiangella sp.]